MPFRGEKGVEALKDRQSDSTAEESRKVPSLDPPRILAVVYVCVAIVLAIAVVVVDWTWPHYWHVESAMQFVFVVGPLAIVVFVVALLTQVFRACRSLLAGLLLVVWLIIALAYVSGMLQSS